MTREEVAYLEAATELARAHGITFCRLRRALRSRA